MKAVALRQYLPIEDPDALLDVELPAPTPGPHDLLVRVEAISVNPVDAKVRAPKSKAEEPPRVLGWDAAGVVEGVGGDVRPFRVGDRVYYAGAIDRPGSNSELHLVDHRIASLMPSSLDFADASALPLTALTAWEGLFERLGLDPEGRDRGKTLLVIGGAGGAGSIVIQLAKAAGLTVIATASRPETRAWVSELGADFVIDHKKPLRAQVEALGPTHVDMIFNTQSTEAWWETMADLIAPLGRIVGIVETTRALDLNLLKSKSASFSWEFMFARSLFAAPDMSAQGDILRRLAALVDAGKVRTTRRELLDPICAANLREAHRRIESGKTIGKIVLVGWNRSAR